MKDLKEEFVRDYLFPCLRAGAIYERKYLLGTAAARPIIAKVYFFFSLRFWQSALFCRVELDTTRILRTSILISTFV